MMQGYVENIPSLIGLIQQAESMQGEVGTVRYCTGSISRVIPANAYRGQYNITPSNEEQILQTEDKVMMQNVTINPIPSNYGLITYDGTVITVS